MSGARPPAWLLRLVSARLPPAEREAVLGDLEEIFQRDTATHGVLQAHLRLLREAASVLRARRSSVHTVRRPRASGDLIMTAIIQDLRHGMRMLARTPAFTLVSLITLALGIGATTAIFSVVNPILFRSLPYPEADRLGLIFERAADGGTSNTGFLTTEDVARRTRLMTSTAAMSSWTATIAGQGEPERLTGQRVSWTYFGTLGVQPMLGRDFTASDDVRGQHFAVILSHGLWRRRFGGDSSIVGRPITLNDVSYTVAGVMPRDFENILSPQAQLWAPLAYDASLPWACRTCRHLRFIGRVAPGATLDQARAELNTLSAAIVAEHPRDYPATGMTFVPIQDHMTRDVRGALGAVLGAVALVLLIACANLTHLLLARSAARQGEFVLRAALGADRGRVMRQVLTESLLLALIGGLLGIGVAWLALHALIAASPPSLPRLSAIGLDGQVLAFSAAITMLTAIVSGLVPSLSAANPDLRGGLQSGRIAGPARHRLRGALVVAEIGMAMMLLIGTGLLMRSFGRILGVSPGFATQGALIMEIEAGGSALPEREDVLAYYGRVLEAARAQPGVQAAGVVSQLPLGGNFDSYSVHVEGRPLDNPELAPSGDRYVVSAGYLEAMGIPVREGRAITEADVDSAMPVILVNEHLARTMFPGENAIGKRLAIGGGSNTVWRTIVGIVGDVRHARLDAPQSNQFYIPRHQWPYTDSEMTLVARTSADPATLAAPLRRAVREVDANQPIVRIATMEQIVAQSVAQRRFALMLFGAFGVLALVLAGAGIYGVMATQVAERLREMGIRSALGASRGRILGLVMGKGARLATGGVICGVLGGLALSRVIAGMLYGTTATDATTYGAVALLLMAVALSACALPAWRAARADPVVVLKQE